VSLGNYCIVITGFVCAQFNRLRQLTRWFLIVGNAIAIVGCDGRLAAVASLVIVAASLIAPRLPRNSAVLYFPIVLLVAFVVVNAAGLQDGPDDFVGRVAHSVMLLDRYDVFEFAGISNSYLSVAVDSGLAYLITTQSLFGVAVLWLFVTLGSPQTNTAQIRFVHAVAIFLSLTLLVSFGFLTIKIAALMWFIYGSLNSASGEAVSLPNRQPARPVGARAIPLSRLREQAP
jgi:putative polymerase